MCKLLFNKPITMKLTMKKNILFALVLLGIIASCTKEQEFKPTKEQEFEVRKNNFRAKTIQTKNDKWGEFKQSLYYSNDKLDSIWCVNLVGDTVGVVRVSSGATSRSYLAYDFIPSIDQNGIKKIEDSLKLKFGEGNYNLFRSLPKSARRSQTQDLILFPDGRVRKQTVKSYRPREDVGVGSKFNNTYILVTTETNVFEYDNNGNIVVNRISKDVHDQQDEKLFQRSILKHELNLVKGEVTEIELFEAKSGENYSSKDRLKFEYLNKKISAIKGNSFQKLFTYSGNIVKITEGSKASNCELDKNGNVVKISDLEGSETTVEYEPGHGDLEIFTLLIDRLLGTPQIK